MPDKSRRNRRNITKNKAENMSPTSSNNEMAGQPANSQAARVTSSKGASNLAPNTYPYFLRDIKWTGVVTGAIIVILIVAYFIFR